MRNAGLKHPIICCKMDEHYQLVYDDCPAKFTANNSNVYTPCQEPLRNEVLRYFDYLVFGLAGLMGLLLTLICFTSFTICVDIV
ncbi:tetraspanin-CD63 receptor [Clonorchis sinensis]|uniref:Tetraspanin-CD63 receptor n=1 Tax=Clonorchis sinensis TaxID=79923 RepID=G7Y2R5_CLOSI|nr:tetraspanin-CD63 receptor [Clonorchis sinensis]